MVDDEGFRNVAVRRPRGAPRPMPTALSLGDFISPNAFGKLKDSAEDTVESPTSNDTSPAHAVCSGCT